MKTSNTDGFTSLHLASFRGNVEMLHYFIQMGADIWTRNHSGMSVMHMAA